MNTAEDPTDTQEPQQPSMATSSHPLPTALQRVGHADGAQKRRVPAGTRIGGGPESFSSVSDGEPALKQQRGGGPAAQNWFSTEDGGKAGAGAGATAPLRCEFEGEAKRAALGDTLPLNVCVRMKRGGK
jgi:hypothetical protein